MDPSVYPGTHVLINKFDLREPHLADLAERMVFARRASEALPAAAREISPQGFRAIHRHLFQDVWDWAGQDRPGELAKGSSMFCRKNNIVPSMNARFALLNSEDNLKGLDKDEFALRAADHIVDLNAIHPFREGNGRVMRSFLQELGRQAGHIVDLRRIDGEPWNRASINSFFSGDIEETRDVIVAAITSSH